MTQMKTSSNDDYCLKQVIVRMGDKKTYYRAAGFPEDEFRKKSQNDEIIYTEHVNDDECNWDDFQC